MNSAAMQSAAAGALIRLAGVSKLYHTPAGPVTALDGVNLSVAEGDFVAVLGKSGAGKSTLINMIAGIDRPTVGEIQVGAARLQAMGEDQIAGWRGRHVGVILQFFQLMPLLSCLDNVMMPMDFAGIYGSVAERRERALALLDRVGIAEHAAKLPGAVSGGQRQRVAIARALANDPPLLLADEPTGNLDSRTATAMMDLFCDLAAEGKTILLVTHDRDLGKRALRRIHIADGRILRED